MKNLLVRNKKIKHFSTYGLMIFFFLTPFEYPLADLMLVSPLRIVSLLTIFLAFIDILNQRILKIDYRFIGIFFWLLYGLNTIFWVDNIARFQSFYSIYFNNAFMFLIFSVISFSEYEVERLKKSIILGVVALLLYMTFFPNAVIYSSYQHRLTLNAGRNGLDQNYLAALMIVAFGLVFYNLCNQEQTKIKKILSICFCLSIFYYIILTGSRSGLLAVMLIVMLSVNTSLKAKILIFFSIIILIIALPKIVKYFPPGLLERFTLKALTGNEGESGTRIIIWKQATYSLKNLKWIFGNGIGSSQTVIGNILGIGKDMAIHNHYIAMLVEVGIIGFLLINYPIFKMIKKQDKQDKDIKVAFLGIMVVAFFVDVATTKFFWSAMILLSVICGKKK